MRLQVYPEYYEGVLSGDGIEVYGKLTNGNRSRMFLSENGQVKISHDKLNSDGTNKAGAANQAISIYENEDIAIGLVCCMDVNNPTLLNKVKDNLDKSECQNKIICISAHMSSDWFSSQSLSGGLHGYVVVLSNGNPDGVKSFIADIHGIKLDSLNLNVGSLFIVSNGRT